MAGREVEHRFEWLLAASPEALWPYVSDTNRFSRDTGLAPVEVEAVRRLLRLDGERRRARRLPARTDRTSSSPKPYAAIQEVAELNAAGRVSARSEESAVKGFDEGPFELWRLRRG